MYIKLILLLLMLGACTTSSYCKGYKNVYQSYNCGPMTLVILRMSDDLTKGSLELTIFDKKRPPRKFEVDNISKNKSELVLKEKGSTSRSHFAGDVLKFEIKNFRLMKGTHELWHCDHLVKMSI